MQIEHTNFRSKIFLKLQALIKVQATLGEESKKHARATLRRMQGLLMAQTKLSVLLVRMIRN
jgi:hypothetical protein